MVLILNIIFKFRSDEVAAEKLETLNVLAGEVDDGEYSEEVAVSYLDMQEPDSPNTNPSTPTSGKRTREEPAEKARTSSSVIIGDLVLPITSRSVKRRRFVGSKAVRDQVHELDDTMDIEQPKIEPYDFTKPKPRNVSLGPIVEKTPKTRIALEAKIETLTTKIRDLNIEEVAEDDILTPPLNWTNRNVTGEWTTSSGVKFFRNFARNTCTSCNVPSLGTPHAFTKGPESVVICDSFYPSKVGYGNCHKVLQIDTDTFFTGVLDAFKATFTANEIPASGSHFVL